MSSAHAAALFQPFKIKSLTLKNRIVMAPMTRCFAPEGVPGDNIAAYYRRRAQSDVGLILSEGTAIDRPAARNEPGIPFFHGEAALAGWKRVIEEVHGAGGKMGPQLWHVGSAESFTPDWSADGPPESPSGFCAPGKANGQAMSDEDIADTIAAYGRGAAEARRLGFDTVEVHAAHGYLIDQFFWPATNQRADGFGGPELKERSRFAVEVMASVRRAVGPDFPVILRVSQWKLQDYAARLAETPDLIAAWLGPLVEAGADLIHCSQRRFWEPEFPEIDGPEGLNFAGWAKKLTGAPTISVGSVGLSGEFIGAIAGEISTPASLDSLIRRMEREEFDLIAVGRALLGDPQWATKVRAEDWEGLKAFSPEAFAELV